MLSKKPVRKIEDLEGLKLRSFESEYYANAYQILGANPTIIAWSEVYLAIQQNTVNAVTSPVSEIVDNNLHEVTDYMTVIDEYPQDVVIVIGEDVFQSISDENKEILIDAANEVGEYHDDLVEESLENDLNVIQEE